MTKQTMLLLERKKYPHAFRAALKKNGLFLTLLVLCCHANAVVSFSHPVDVGDTAGCQPPMSIRAVSVTSSSAMLVWHGTSTQYEYAYMRSEYSSGISLLSEGIAANDTVILIDGLRPNTSYSFYVRSRCGQTASPWS